MSLTRSSGHAWKSRPAEVIGIEVIGLEVIGIKAVGIVVVGKEAIT